MRTLQALRCHRLVLTGLLAGSGVAWAQTDEEDVIEIEIPRTSPTPCSTSDMTSSIACSCGTCRPSMGSMTASRTFP